MQLKTIQKLGGISIILGALLLLTYSVCFPLCLPLDQVKNDFTLLVLNTNWLWITSVSFFGVIFMIFGFTAVYSTIFSESGLIGFLGYLFVQIAYLLQACKVTWEIFLYPTIAINKTSQFLLRDLVIKNSSLVTIFRTSASVTIFLGIILLCISLMRSKFYPKIAGILIFIGALIYGLGPFLPLIIAISGIFIFSIGCFILGLKLMKNNSV